MGDSLQMPHDVAAELKWARLAPAPASVPRQCRCGAREASVLHASLVHPHGRGRLIAQTVPAQMRSDLALMGWANTGRLEVRKKINELEG